MTGTTLTGWLATCVLTLTAAYSLLRMRAAHRLGDEAGRRADSALALMILLMAAMFCPLAANVPQTIWLLASGALSLTLLILAGQGVRRDGHRHGVRGAAHRHCWHHVLASLAMVGLVAASDPAGDTAGSGGHAMAGMPGMSGMSMHTMPLLLTVPLLAYFWAFTLWSGIRLIGVAGVAPAGRTGPSSARWVLTAPELAVACETVMGIAMGYMVLVML
jgi:hypothetical protein